MAEIVTVAVSAIFGGFLGAVLNVVYRLFEERRRARELGKATCFALIEELEHAERLRESIASEGKLPLVVVRLPYYLSENFAVIQPEVFLKLVELRFLLATYVYYAKEVNELIERRAEALLKEGARNNGKIVKSLEEAIVMACRTGGRHRWQRGSFPYTLNILIGLVKDYASFYPYRTARLGFRERLRRWGPNYYLRVMLWRLRHR